MNNYEEQPLTILKKTVSDVCDVEITQMLDKNVTRRHYHYNHARWLLWLAIKSLTHYSNNVIARMTKDKDGNSFSVDSVGKGIAKMSQMTSKDYVWRQKWQAIKEVIDDLKKESGAREETKQKITIIVPFGIEVEVKNQ